MKIAVIGSGIAGLAAAWLLRRDHDVVVFEKNARLGGHTNTQYVDDPAGPLAIDTGFIVHNDRNYPRLLALFDLLGIKTQPSDMSFSASINAGAVEYAGDALFAQPSNLVSPSHWRMLSDIVRFNRLGKDALATNSCQGQSLGAWLDQHRFSEAFVWRYLLPMAVSVWSRPSQSVRDFSAPALLEFFNNHGLLDLKNRPNWRTVVGGTTRYVERIESDLARSIHTNRAIRSVRRRPDGVALTDRGGHEMVFEGVVFASHADETLKMLEDPDAAEIALLGAFQYRANQAFLHSDVRLMPKRRRAWASWNYLTQQADEACEVSISYWMNRLQRLDAQKEYLVTLNPLVEPHPSEVHYQTEYTHPVFNQATRKAQASMGHLQGHRNCWYCGAWMGYGFHEDGLGAAVEVVSSLGVELPDAIDQARAHPAPYTKNFEPWSGPGSHLIHG